MKMYIDDDMIEDCLEAIEEMIEDSDYADLTHEIHNAEDFKEEFSKCYKFAEDEMSMDGFFRNNYTQIYRAWRDRGLEDRWNNNATDLVNDDFLNLDFDIDEN